MWIAGAMFIVTCSGAGCNCRECMAVVTVTDHIVLDSLLFALAVVYVKAFATFFLDPHVIQLVILAHCNWASHQPFSLVLPTAPTTPVTQ